MDDPLLIGGLEMKTYRVKYIYLFCFFLSKYILQKFNIWTCKKTSSKSYEAKCVKARHKLLHTWYWSSTKNNFPGKTVNKKENNTIASFTEFYVWQGLKEFSTESVNCFINCKFLIFDFWSFCHNIIFGPMQ